MSSTATSCFEMVFSQMISKLLGATNTTGVLSTLPHLHLKDFSLAASTQYAFDWLTSLYPTRDEACAMACLLDSLCSFDGELVQAASFFYNKVS